MPAGTPTSTLHLRIEVDLDEESTVAPFPAIFPSFDADAAVEAARKYAPMIRPLEVARSTPEYRSVCKIVNGKQKVYLTLYEAVLVYQLGWQWIGDCRSSDDGCTEFPPQFLALLPVRKAAMESRIEGKGKKIFVDELLGEGSVAWMRQILAVVASGERDA